MTAIFIAIIGRVIALDKAKKSNKIGSDYFRESYCVISGHQQQYIRSILNKSHYK